MDGYRKSGIFGKLKIANKAVIQRNSIICHDYNRKAINNRVNLNYWKLDSLNDVDNLGDYLSVVVVENMLNRKVLSLDTSIKGRKHLYAIGSILMTGFQDCTVWGSGILRNSKTGVENKATIFINKHIRKLDIRAVRGPLTREYLSDIGITCPEVYGDPAILMPLFYSPKEDNTKTDYVVINHYTKNTAPENNISLLTRDYKTVINKINNTKKVITGSLHGLILAEAYGVPAVLINDNKSSFKFKDYYYSTGRYNFPIVDQVKEAIMTDPPELPNLSSLQKGLIESFPYDLWV